MIEKWFNFVADGIFEFLNGVVFPILYLFVALVCIIVFYISCPLWIIPYALIMRKKQNDGADDC